MSWFDKVQANLKDAAAKAGLTPEKLKSVADTLHQELSKIPDHAKALKATAEQHGIEVDKIQTALAHAGAEIGKTATEVSGKLDDAFKSATAKPPSQ